MDGPILHRVLKPDGVLSFSDHHMKDADIMTGMTNGLLFKLLKKRKRMVALSPHDSCETSIEAFCSAFSVAYLDR